VLEARRNKKMEDLFLNSIEVLLCIQAKHNQSGLCKTATPWAFLLPHREAQQCWES